MNNKSTIFYVTILLSLTNESSIYNEIPTHTYTHKRVHTPNDNQYLDKEKGIK